MQVARRVYLYLISFISLMMVLSGAANVLRLLAELALGVAPEYYSDISPADYRREQFSLWGAVLVVGAIVWALHWILAQRGVAATNPAADEERASLLRKLFLYAVLMTTLWQVAFGLADALRTVLRAFPVPARPDWSLTLAAAGAQVLVYGLAGLYYWTVRTRDNDATPEAGAPATVRRWYFYLVNYVALSVLMGQIADLLRYCWEIVTAGSLPWSPDAQWVPLPVAGSLAGIGVAGGIWLWHWQAVQRHVVGDEDEQRSALRKVYLYGVTLQTVSVTLANAAFFLYSLFRVFWGSNPVSGTGDTMLSAAGGPVLTAVVYGLFWAYHWQALRQDAHLPASGPPVNAALRQLYQYLVALIGLALVAGGVMDLLRLLIDAGLGGNATINLGPQGWGDQISFFATLILIGTPVWLVSWLRVQREALAADGAEARQALPRRLYLFLILFLTVIALLGSAAVLIYQVLRNFGAPAVGWISDMSWALATTLTVSVLLAYHLAILVGDLRAHAPAPTGAPLVPAPAPTPLPATIVLLRGADAGRLEAVIALLQRQLPTSIQADVIAAAGVTPVEISAWLASRGLPAAPPLSPPPVSRQPPLPQPASI